MDFTIVKYGDAIIVRGNTYPHRAALHAAGGRWFHLMRGWMFPAEQRNDVEALVDTL